MTERHSPGDARTTASAGGVATRSTCSDVRDIALAGHAGAGKTSLAEAFLYVAGHTDRLGKVDEGNTLLDYDPEEIRRDIARTRSELSENVNALGDKVNPGSIAKRQVGRARGAAVSVKDAVLGSASDAADTGQRVAGNIEDTSRPAPNAIRPAAIGEP